MKRLISLLLSLLLFPCSFAPAEVAQTPPLSTEDVLDFLAENLADVLCGEQNGLDVTLTTPDGKVFSGGFGMTESGLAAHYQTPDYALAADINSFSLTDAQGSVSVPFSSLMSTLFKTATGAKALPNLSDMDFAFLAPIGQELLQALIDCDGITYTFTSQLLSLHIDLDAVIHYVDTMIPAILQRHAAALNSMLAQVSLFVGAECTVEQLLSLWKELKLPDFITGLTLDAVIFQTGDTLTLMSSCMNWSIKAEVSNASFACTLTAPNGTVYAFDTRDFLTLASIFSALPDSITEDAFKWLQTTEYAGSHNYGITTTSATLDLTLLERDIKTGLTKAINANHLTIDVLCEKYQPLIKLLTGRARFRSGTLLTLIEHSDLLPDWTGSLTAIYDQSNDTLEASAHLAEDDETFALFDLYYDANCLNASIRDAYGDFSLMLTGINDRYNTSLTLSCSKDLGGFNSITFATGLRNSYYNTYTSVTTDTDVFHYTEDRYGFDLKIGEYSVNLHTGRDYHALRLRWPYGYLNSSVSDVGWDITSNYGTLSGRNTYDGMKIDGTIMDGYTPTHFSILADTENRLLTASIMPYRSSGVYLRCQPDRLSLLADGSELVIADAHSNIPGQNVTTAAFDDELLGTLVSTMDGNRLTMQLYPSASTEGSCWTLTFDFDAPGKALPTDAATITPEEFLFRLDALCFPQPEAPAIEEQPLQPELQTPAAQEASTPFPSTE